MKMKHYQAEQQVKYLHLQAEIDALLEQLQTLKQNRLVSPTGECKQAARSCQLTSSKAN